MPALRASPLSPYFLDTKLAARNRGQKAGHGTKDKHGTGAHLRLSAFYSLPTSGAKPAALAVVAGILTR